MIDEALKRATDLPLQRIVAAVALGIVGCWLAAPGARGQEAADWVRVEVGLLALEGPAAYEATLKELAGRARRFLPDLERSLGVAPAGPILMVLIPPDPSPYPAVARLDEAAPPWAAGFALSEARIGGIRMAQADRYPFGDAGGVLAHEIAHILIHDAAGPASAALPRWFAEGVATRAQRRWSLRDAWVYSSALLAGPLPTLAELDRAFLSSEPSARLAYAASFDFIQWAEREYGEGMARRVLLEVRERPFPEAWHAASGVSLARSEASWRRTSLALYRWVPALTGAGTLWLGITLLFLLAAWRRRARTQKLYEEWEDDEEPPAGDNGGWIH